MNTSLYVCCHDCEIVLWYAECINSPKPDLHNKDLYIDFLEEHKHHRLEWYDDLSNMEDTEFYEEIL